MHEPPEVGFEAFGVCDELQRELKEEGGGQDELDCKTTCLDHKVEHHILHFYNLWVYIAREERESEQQQQFYGTLCAEVDMYTSDVLPESRAHETSKNGFHGRRKIRIRMLELNDLRQELAS